MKLSVLVAASAAHLASAHYFFDKLVIDGKETKQYEFVRENTRPQKYNPTKWKNPLDDMTPDLPDFRCNKGAFASAGRTGVAEVKAGSKLAMKLGVGATMRHPGPAAVYMSKAPGSVKEYEGDLEWFKVFEEGVCDKSKGFTTDAWCTWDKDRIEFTVPLDTPDGEYLVRPEHIGLHGAHDGQAEFYYGCAQIKVVGGGKGTPGPTIKFPGPAYSKDGKSFNFSLWGGYKEYPMPGPAVWTGGSSGAPNTTEPDVAQPNTDEPEAPQPSAVQPPADQPTPTQPTSSQPTATQQPTIPKPSTSLPSVPKPSTAVPNVPKPDTPKPTPTFPAMPTMPVPNFPQPVTSKPGAPQPKPTTPCGGALPRNRRAFRELLRKE